MQVTSIIVSGGKGKRFSACEKKQFSLLKDKPVLAHTLCPFQRSNSIDGIILVVPREDLSYVKDELLKKYDAGKVKKVIPGGKERQDSVFEGLKNLPSDTDYVFIHDGVRPFLKIIDIEKSLNEAKGCGAVVFGIPARNTIKRVDSEGSVVATLKRDELFEIQTPQVFKRDILVDAYKNALHDNYYSTDDAALVERAGHIVKIFPGRAENIKITFDCDLKAAEKIMEDWTY